MRRDGSVKFQGREYFLSEALRGETTGWVEVDVIMALLAVIWRLD